MQTFHSQLLNKFPNLTHTFTGKKDGNLAFHVGDDETNIIYNHQKLAQKLSYTLKTVVHMKQIHSDIVKVVTDEDNFKNPPTCDAIITNKKKTPLMVMVADCSPILFYDPQKEVIAAAHAGRAGAFSNIIQNIIDTFTQEFHSKVEDIVVTVGPAICVECYEVGEEIYKEAKKRKMEYALTQTEDKYHLNIRAILQKQLREAGVKERNFEISAHCSKCHSDFFSYRENKKCGRFAGVIMLR
ncbi:MAG: peptidoglycan editing factor PgeF [Sulfurimonas sp.]